MLRPIVSSFQEVSPLREQEQGVTRSFGRQGAQPNGSEGKVDNLAHG